MNHPSKGHCIKVWVYISQPCLPWQDCVARWSISFSLIRLDQWYSATQRQTTVTAYLKSKQLLLFAFASGTALSAFAAPLWLYDRKWTEPAHYSFIAPSMAQLQQNMRWPEIGGCHTTSSTYVIFQENSQLVRCLPRLVSIAPPRKVYRNKTLQSGPGQPRIIIMLKTFIE